MNNAKLFMMLGKLHRTIPTLRGHFAPAYLVGSNMLRAYLFFIYGYLPVNAGEVKVRTIISPEKMGILKSCHILG